MRFGPRNILDSRKWGYGPQKMFLTRKWGHLSPRFFGGGSNLVVEGIHRCYWRWWNRLYDRNHIRNNQHIAECENDTNRDIEERVNSERRNKFSQEESVSAICWKISDALRRLVWWRTFNFLHSQVDDRLGTGITICWTLTIGTAAQDFILFKRC